MLQGLSIDANGLAVEAFKEAGPGGNYLGCAHTMKNFKTANYASQLADTNSYEQWVEDGAENAEQRANRSWKRMLSRYQAPAIAPGVDEALRAFVERRKRSVEDQWY